MEVISEYQELIKKTEEVYNIKGSSYDKKDNKILIIDGAKTYILWEYLGKKNKLAKALKYQEYLYKEGCRAMLPVLKNKEGELYIEFSEKFFFLTENYEGEELNNSSCSDLIKVANALGGIHLKSQKIKEVKLDKDCFIWPKHIQGRLADLLVYYKYIREQGAQTDFERLYVESFNELYNQGQDAVEHMVLASYGQQWEEEEGICINNVLKSNIIISQDGPLFLDLTQITYGPIINDFALLTKSYMPAFAWDISCLKRLIREYDKRNPLNDFEKHFLLAQLRFPSRYWLYAYRYFSKNGNTLDLTKRLKVYIKDYAKRDLCLDYLEKWLWGEWDNDSK